MGIEGIKHTRKIQRSLVCYVICHAAFTLHKKAVTRKLKGPKPLADMQDPMSVQHNHSGSALKSSGTAQGTAWEMSQATEGDRLHAQQERQRI